jgi:hypothetical protein
VTALAALVPGLLMAAAESGGRLGRNSADGWAWGPFLEGFLGPAMILAGMTLVILISLRIKRRNRELADLGRRSAGGTPARPAGPAGAAEREAIERMAVDLEEVARSISAMLDTRMRTLEKLIRDADERIARLGGTAGEAGVGTEGPADSAPAPTGGPGAAASRTLAHHAHIYGLADQGLSVQEIAEQTGYQQGEVELVLSLRRAAGSDGQ